MESKRNELVAAQQAEGLRSTTDYPELAGLGDEWPRARSGFFETRARIEDALGAVGTRATLEGRPLDEAVGRVTDSVVRNANALILLARLETLGLLGLLQETGKVRPVSSLLDKTSWLSAQEFALARQSRDRPQGPAPLSATVRPDWALG